MSPSGPASRHAHTAPAPPRRTNLALPVLGHLAVAVVVTLLIVEVVSSPRPRSSAGGALVGEFDVLFALSVGALAGAQALALVALAAQWRVLAAGRLDDTALATGARWTGGAGVMALFPIVLIPLGVPLAALPPLSPALLLAAMAGTQLLACRHAAWTYRRLTGRGTRAVPEERGRRLRAAWTRNIVLLVLLAAAALVLAVVTVDTEVRRTPSAAGVSLLQAAAAAAVVVVPLTLIPALLQGRSAFVDGTVDRPRLDRAASTMRRLAVPAAAVAVVLAVTGLLADPAVLALALGRAVPLVLTLLVLMIHLIGVVTVNLGNPGPPHAVARPTPYR